ncbi:MAG: hypothetical protein KDE34_07915, partial [Anaerolineales bacterium]|nr:hypothetical protein [Anaerolineales bacterium]
WSESRDRLLGLQEAVAQERNKLRELEEQLRELNEKRDGKREKLEMATRQLAIFAEREQMLNNQLSELALEIPRLTEQKQSASQDLAVSLESLGVAQATVVEAEYKQRAFQEASAGQQQALAHWRREVSRLEQAERDTQNNLGQLQGRLVQLQERHQETGSEQAEAEAPEGSEQLPALETALAAAQAALTAIRQERQAGRDELASRQKELTLKRQEGRQLSNQLNEQAKELARLETRLEMLAERRQKELALPAGFPSVARLAEGLTIPAEYRTAIEAALGQRLTTLLLNNDADLWSLLRQADPASPLSLLVADDLAAPDAPAAPAGPILGRASELIEFSDRIAPAGRYLLDGVFLVADATAAYEVGVGLPAGALAVTPDGLIVEGGGLVRREPRSTADSPLAREEAWRAAQQEVAAAQSELAGRQKLVDAHQSELGALQEQVDAFQPQERAANQREQEANQQVSQAQRALDRQRQQVAYLEKQRQEKAAEAARLQKRLNDTETQLAELQAKLAERTEALAHARQELATIPAAEMAQEQRNWQQQVDAAQTIVAGRQAVVDSRRAALNQLNNQLERLESRQRELQQQRRDIDLQQATAREEQLQQELTELLATLEPLREARAASQKAMQAAEEAVIQQQRQTHNLETVYTRAQVAMSQHENMVEGLRERIKADVGLVSLSSSDDQAEQSPLPLQGIVEQLPIVDELPEDIESNIQDYRGQMQRMGAINPDAPAEFEETEQRYDFLTEQVEDLTTTEKQLRHVIAELDDLTSQAFADTVTRVNEIFGGTFAQLFGGGTAELVLTEPDDLTVSGVDIVAQLPRRREQGLGLLSGGERSLTAAALIFSLLKVSPTPFCVMDEVDAMLDEANVNRFRDLLRELSLQTQFIVITHNRGTVQAAQTVYGISMGGDSVSQVISIKPEEYINAQELI